jgi:hypothetical protein
MNSNVGNLGNEKMDEFMELVKRSNQTSWTI